MRYRKKSFFMVWFLHPGLLNREKIYLYLFWMYILFILAGKLSPQFQLRCKQYNIHRIHNGNIYRLQLPFFLVNMHKLCLISLFIMQKTSNRLFIGLTVIIAESTENLYKYTTIFCSTILCKKIQIESAKTGLVY